MRCLICRLAVDSGDKPEDVNQKTPFSKKPIHAIIGYLAKTAKPPIDLRWTSDQLKECHICKSCFQDVLVYDEYMIKIIEVQKRIVSFLKNLTENDEDVEIQVLDECTNGVSEKFEEVETHIKFATSDNDVKATSTDEIHINALKSNEDEVVERDDETSEDNTRDFSNDDLNYEIDDSNIEKRNGVTRIRKYKIPVKCKICHQTFKNRTLLRRHCKSTHNPLKIRSKCEICGITAKDEEYLELHMNIHDGKSELECRYCNKRYTRRINVVRHMQKHWDKKKFQCERCGLRFSERPIYYNHRLQHEAEEEPLICPVCNRSFKTRRTYRNHLWIHREDRPRYECEICGKKFVEKYTLKVHGKSHNDDHNEEQQCNDGRGKTTELTEEQNIFECIVCGTQFFNSELCDQHMKVEHDVIIKTEDIFIESYN